MNSVSINWQLILSINYTTVAVPGEKSNIIYDQLHTSIIIQFSKCCSTELLLRAEIIILCAVQDFMSLHRSLMEVLCSPLNVGMQYACHNYDKHFSFVSCSQGLFFLFLVKVEMFHLTCMMEKKLYLQSYYIRFASLPHCQLSQGGLFNLYSSWGWKRSDTQVTLTKVPIVY